MNMKKTINISLILALVHSLLGCQGMTSTIKRQSDISNYLDTQEKVTITTTDSVSYFFNTNTYTVKGDLLEGKGQRFVEGKKQNPESIIIAIKDIAKIKYGEDAKVGKSAFILISFGLIAVLIITVVNKIP